MDTALISALSATIGSIVGGSASVITTWITQRTSSRRTLIHAELQSREALYQEFISECSRLAVDSLGHGLEKAETMLTAYALLNRIRLAASEPVLEAAELVVDRIAEQYFSPTVSIEEVRKMTHSWSRDPLKAFGEACRAELKELRKKG